MMTQKLKDRVDEQYAKLQKAASDVSMHVKDVINEKSTLPKVIAAAFLATDAAKEAEIACDAIEMTVDNANVGDRIFNLEKSKEIAKQTVKDATDARNVAEKRIDEMIDGITKSASEGDLNFKKTIKEKLKIES